jgi:putative ABC transport system permease protein
MMNNLYLLVAIFLYGFIAVITLIGMTNVFNTISANIALRSSEFASLKSIGMTTKEFNRMIRLESLMYSLKALIIGVPLGLGLSWLFYKAMSGKFDFGYVFPIDSIVIAVLAVAVLIFIVMKYSVNLVNKQNIIETIRSDTV